MYNIKINRDSNHEEIVKAAKKAECDVIDLAAVGKGCPDLSISFICKSGRRLNMFVEIKSHCKASFTKDQEKFYKKHKRTHIWFIYSATQLKDTIQYYKEKF